MKLDNVSYNLIKLALILDKKIPGAVSEIWIDSLLIEKLKSSLPHDEVAIISELEQQISNVKDSRRKKYLNAVFKSLTYQLDEKNTQATYSEFSENTFGYRIERITEQELEEIEKQITQIEKQIGTTRFQVLEEDTVQKEKYLETFTENVEKVKKLLPSWLTTFTGKSEFLFEVTNNKPWTAFNTHFAPFQSKLTINNDIAFTKTSFLRLACHEAYAGHHSELSHKDKFLLEEGRGEHGLVITFSPQTFISESIAESMYCLLNIRDINDPITMLIWYYERLIFMLQNLATFLFFDDKLSREDTRTKLQKYKLRESDLDGVINFSTDSLFGKYAPVYSTAFNFMSELYERANNKEIFLREVFTQPCTGEILNEE